MFSTRSKTKIPIRYGRPEKIGTPAMPCATPTEKGWVQPEPYPAATEQKEAPPPGRRSVPASLTWVPGCGGLMMGGEAVLDLARRAKEEVK